MPRENKARAASAPQGGAAPAAADAPFDDAQPETKERQPAEAEQPAAGANAAGGAASDAEAGASDTEASADDDLAAWPPEKLIAKLQQSQTEHAEAHDGLLRARAEIENVRRRSQNEIVAARKFAIEGFARELLGVRDSLERAAAVALDEGASEPVGQMKEGLGLTLKQFDLALARFAVVEVEAAPGTRFDPECHQAISTAASDEFEADHIVSVVQKGFLLKERLLRPAMVIVAQKA